MLAKITHPVLIEVFQRIRLFRWLDHARRRPVAWVTGPPGSGKTTLVGSYLQNRNLPGLWYQIDEGDADPATFFHYLGLAAKKAAPHKRRPLPHLTPEYLPGLSTFTRRYFRDLYSRLTSPFVVVFDNYQEVPPDSRLHEVIRDGLSEIPEGGQVIVVSRREPPPVLARWQANQAMALLGWEELRLTAEESQGIAQLGDREKLTQEALLLLHRGPGGGRPA